MSTKESNRLVLLDFLRGFALWGILISNIPIMSAPYYMDSDFQDFGAKLVKAVYTFFVTGKFFVLFSFVFGYGFAILLQSIIAKGKDPKRIYFRRLFGLFVLGLLHAFLLFEGDILVTYSMLGVFLFYMKDKESVWKQWILGFWILSIVGYAVLGYGAYYTFGDGLGLAKQLTQEAIFNHYGSIWDTLRQQQSDLLLSFPFILLFNGPTAAMMFLVGLWAGKNQIFKDPYAIWKSFQGKKRIILLVGILTNAGYTLSTFYPDNLILGVLPSFLLAFGGVSFALLYVLGIIYFLFLQNREESTFVKLVATAGSMSLTNYLLQSLLCTMVFDAWGFGFYARLHPAEVIIVTIPVYVLNLLFSSLWKQKFDLGPMEWLLRKWTYA